MELFIPDDPLPIHFMGIGGVGMSALALVARRRGVKVSGCDRAPDDVSDLSAAGITVSEGHGVDHVCGIKALVRTSAVPEDHPEVNAAHAAGIPVIRRAEALGEIVNSGRVVACAGTHGKTTTTAMTAIALAATGMDPTGLVGGRVADWGGSVRVGGSDIFVVEADEYDRSFLSLKPEIAVINNVEADHLECFGSIDDLEAGFIEFARCARHVIVNSDDRGALRVARGLDVRASTVGTAREADFVISAVRRERERTIATLVMPDGMAVQLQLVLPGLHNIRNAAMATCVTHFFGGHLDAAVQELNEFAGVERRFQVLGSARGITVVDDYAHHPTEVAAALAAARQRFPGQRLVAVFQPHLYSRTKVHGDAFGIVLATADLVVVTSVYPAREDPIPGVTGEVVAKAAGIAGAAVEWVPDFATLPASLRDLTIAGDVVLTLGAGDITKIGPLLLRSMQENAA